VFRQVLELKKNKRNQVALKQKGRKILKGKQSIPTPASGDLALPRTGTPTGKRKKQGFARCTRHKRQGGRGNLQKRGLGRFGSWERKGPPSKYEKELTETTQSYR